MFLVQYTQNISPMDFSDDGGGVYASIGSEWGGGESCVCVCVSSNPIQGQQKKGGHLFPS